MEYKKVDFSELVRSETKGLSTTTATDKEAVNWIKLKMGENRIRILPPTDKNPKLFHRVDVHFKVFLDGRQRAVKCIDEECGQCPICEVMAATYEVGDKDAARNLKPVPQFLCNVLTPEGMIGVLVMDKKLFDAITEKHKSIQEELEIPFDMWDAKNGIWTVIGKFQESTGKLPPFDKKNVYKIVANRVKNSCPLTTEIEAKMTKDVRDLEKLYKSYNYDELSALYGTKTSVVSEPSPHLESLRVNTECTKTVEVVAEKTTTENTTEDEIEAYLKTLSV